MSSPERFILGEEIARGGMGAVFRATDTVLGREVAVKVLLDRYAPDGGTARRFADEAHITGQLQHPGIPPVHDLGTLPDGRPFLAMKLIEGDTLDDLLKPRPDPAADRGRFVAVFEAVCQAVAYAHAHDVVHRDLKPANVMVGAFGEVQVLDWGLAKNVRRAACGVRNAEPDDPECTTDLLPHSEIRIPHSDDPLTRAGSVLGTPAYMPPEQAIGAVDRIDRRSDVFGLGGILAAVLTGRPPFTGDTAESTRQLAARGKVEGCFARLDACGAEPELVALCRRCLAPEQDDRPADAGEVAAAVAALRADAEARARQAELDRATAEATVAEGRKRRRVQLGLAAAVVLLVAGAGGVAVWRANEDGNRRAEAARLDGEERERKARAADAVAEVLDQTKAALEAGDAARAAPLLDQAGRRAADDAVADHAARLAAYRRDLAILRALDDVNDYRWTPLDAKYYPSAARAATRWAAAFAGYGIVPGTTAPAEAAARVNSSPARAALLAGLDGWLAASRSAAVRELLAVTDPDPFRDEVRRALAGLDRWWVVIVLAGRPEWAGQPPGLAGAYATGAGVPIEARLAVLGRAVATRPDDFALLMSLAHASTMGTAVGAADRAEWHRAAVAVRPRSAAAQNNLGSVLRGRGDLSGAEAAYREAIRSGPNFALPRNGLGIVLRDRGDLGGAAAAFREAARLDPADAIPHLNLGNVLRELKNPGGAEAAYREAIRLAPNYGGPHHGLGMVLYDRKDLGGAEAAFRKAVRFDPSNFGAYNGLSHVHAARGEHDAALKLMESVAARSPKGFADPQTSLRYNAACHACLVAAGVGKESPPTIDRPGLRRKALGWLTDDLAYWKRAAATNPHVAAAKLAHWLDDPDLQSLRPGLARIAMSAAERAACDRLWADVRSTLAGLPPPPLPPPPGVR